VLLFIVELTKLEKEMSEFEVLHEQEFDDKELESFSSSIYQDCEDDDDEAESNAFANSSLESDSRDFTMPEHTGTSTRTNNKKKKRKSTTKSCSTTSQTNVMPELLIPIVNSAESTLQTTIDLYMKNVFRHYKDEDERRILLGCWYRDVPEDLSDTSVRNFLTENGIATFSKLALNAPNSALRPFERIMANCPIHQKMEKITLEKYGLLSRLSGCRNENVNANDVKIHTIIIAHFCPLVPGRVQKSASLGMTGDYRNHTVINGVYHGFRVMNRLGQLDDEGMKIVIDGIVFIDFEMMMIHTNKARDFVASEKGSKNEIHKSGLMVDSIVNLIKNHLSDNLSVITFGKPAKLWLKSEGKEIIEIVHEENVKSTSHPQYTQGAYATTADPDAAPVL
jgi:hypothetical protein